MNESTWKFVQALRPQPEPYNGLSSNHSITIDMLTGDRDHDWSLIVARFSNSDLNLADCVPKGVTITDVTSSGSITRDTKNTKDTNKVTSLRAEELVTERENEMGRLIYDGRWVWIDEFECVVCGEKKPITGERGPVPKTCSAKCRKAYSRRNKKAAA